VTTVHDLEDISSVLPSLSGYLTPSSHPKSCQTFS
jgi:hypothetical protein